MAEVDVASPAAGIFVGVLVGFFAGFCFSKRGTCEKVVKKKKDSDAESDDEVHYFLSLLVFSICENALIFCR